MHARSTLSRSALSGLALLASAGLLVGPLAGTAFAHVTIQPGEAEQGGYAAFAFRVPNERDTAGTTKLEVTFPADHPFKSARTKPVPGWTANVVKEGEAVKSVTWTADPGVRIGTTEFQEFPLSLGPLPEDTDVLVFPAIQTYDNGEVVTWDAPPSAGEEAERPAPTLELTPSTGDGHGAGGVSAASAEHDDSDSTARWLGGAGLAVGALGVGAGAGAVLRGRRQGS